jgi:type III pantothenate kinase
MILCLDIGNSQIFGGVFDNEKIKLRFRYDTRQSSTSDQLGIFLKNVLREHNLDGSKVEQISICSVVPSLDYSIRAACKKYFNVEPFFLKAGVKTGIKIKYYNPPEVGADLIAGALGAIQHYPGRNIVVVDFGTATTFSVISAGKEFLGGVILAGIKLCMDALQINTAKLFPVEIIPSKTVVGRSTTESIQSGLYYGQLGAIHELIQRITQEIFNGDPPIVIGTGGFAHLFENEKLFTIIDSDLVLNGLYYGLNINL